MKNIHLVVALLLLSVLPAAAVPAVVGGESDHRYSSFAFPSPTYTTTAGNFLFLHVGGNDYGASGTCTTPPTPATR